MSPEGIVLTTEWLATLVGLIEACIRQPAKAPATGPDHLTDNLGNICKVTTTGCHGNFHAQQVPHSCLDCTIMVVNLASCLMQLL